MPVYDPLTTPTRGLGVLPETVRTWPGALRSAQAVGTPAPASCCSAPGTTPARASTSPSGTVPVVRGKAGAADARLFPVADAVAYAERRLGTHRPRDEFAHPGA
jgi:aminoglycoside N3'-acetyltransferase